MLDSHRDACVFDGRVKILARAALAVNLKTVASEDLKMRGYGNVDMTIEGVAKERAALFFDTDDAHRQAANFQRLSDRIFVRKELVFDVAAQHDDQRRTFDLVVGNEASFGNRFVFDVDHV